MFKRKLSILSILSILTIMIGCDSATQAPTANADQSPALNPVQTAHPAGSSVYVDANASGTEDGSQANPYDTIQEGVDHAAAEEVVTLLSDFTLSSQVTISSPLTLDGNGYAIDAAFNKTSNSNNSAIGVQSDDVTVQNLKLTASGDQPWPKQLHGVNVYEASGVFLENLDISGFEGSGVVVNGSEVTVFNIRTADNGWHGINVDQGDNVTNQATLKVTGVSSHDENSPLPPSDFTDGTHVPDIFVDDINALVTVNDVNNQYVSDIVDFRGGEAEVYTHLKSEARDACKKGGWADYGFKNQGKCIQFVNTGKASR